MPNILCKPCPIAAAMFSVPRQFCSADHYYSGPTSSKSSLLREIKHGTNADLRCYFGGCRRRQRPSSACRWEWRWYRSQPRTETAVVTISSLFDGQAMQEGGLFLFVLIGFCLRVNRFIVYNIGACACRVFVFIVWNTIPYIGVFVARFRHVFVSGWTAHARCLSCVS